MHDFGFRRIERYIHSTAPHFHTHNGTEYSARARENKRARKTCVLLLGTIRSLALALGVCTWRMIRLLPNSRFSLHSLCWKCIWIGVVPSCAMSWLSASGEAHFPFLSSKITNNNINTFFVFRFVRYSDIRASHHLSEQFPIHFTLIVCFTKSNKINSFCCSFEYLCYEEIKDDATTDKLIIHFSCSI